MTRIHVKFVGGQLGGEERTIDRRDLIGRIYRVPVVTYVSPLAVGQGEPWTPFQYDEYEYRGEGREGVWLMRYIRPNVEGLQREITRLKKRIEELENPARKGLVRFRR